MDNLYETDFIEIFKNGKVCHGGSRGDGQKVGFEMRQMIENYLAGRTTLVSFVARSTDGKHIVRLMMEP